MKLNKSDKQFIRNNQDRLRGFFERQIEEYKEQVFLLPCGEERDRVILLVQELKAWLKAVNILKDINKKSRDKNPDYI